MSERLTFSDYDTDPSTLAQRLIGTRLVRFIDGERVSGTIIETEAYLGVEDKAAHSVGARFTDRTAPMFERAGTAYVFMTYGMHHCFNVVCAEVGDPCAVLIRALEPKEGFAVMRDRRGAKRKTPVRHADLCSGPAKLCQALVIDRAFTGVNLCEHPELWLEHGERFSHQDLALGPRIGVDYAQEWADAPLRWWVKGHPGVSR